MKKLKIAFIVQSFPTVSETFVVNQIINLIDEGYDVTIFSFNKNTNPIIHKNVLDYKLIDKTIYWEETKISKIGRFIEFLTFLLKNHEHISFRKIFRIFNFKKYGKKALNLRNYTRYRWITKQASFDIFHAHFGPSGKYVAEMKSFGFFSNAKFITSFHGYDISPHLLSYYIADYKLLFSEVDLLTVNTIYTEKLLRRITRKNKIEILPVGLNTRIFKGNALSENNKVQLLFVGRLISFKAPDLVIKIAEKLIQNGKQFHIDIIGEGVMYTQLEEYIHKNSLDNFIKLRGALSQEEIISYMSKSDIFIFPGIYDSNGRAETQGLVLQEAQAMELPVIVSDVGGMKYGMINNITGFVVEEKNIAGFVDKIELLIADKELRKEMGKQGRKFVVSNYDSKVLGNKLTALYDQILNE
ncbi:colanic acid/amylovoran biosynthesis glycosyltransferase [Zunongwangia mangrovi]|uniref:Colanic acid/amylovoran biosynthesis glycosyltransferase n=1 Tax=Zunongwangia mangrovi TaxID=1334022 RepID=A0A1I1LLJ1_9FLAO|nr:glycosyltransferase [Zunongwangia mangrovi]SFC74067.1 colanic acid/amylovoran biosynthesis glycosyltransferase [Zunongwangia mangrovi]